MEVLLEGTDFRVTCNVVDSDWPHNLGKKIKLCVFNTSVTEIFPFLHLQILLDFSIFSVVNPNT